MEPASAQREICLNGLAISGGAAHGRVFVLEKSARDEVPFYRIGTSEVSTEQERLNSALRIAAEHLDALVAQVSERIGGAQANIFVAQKMMVEDPVLTEEMMTLIADQRMNAEAALDKSLDSYESVLLELDNEYLKERASDIGEIRRRVLDVLRDEDEGRDHEPARPLFEFEEPRIIVAEELTPGETVSLDPKFAMGFVTEHGGPGSHAAILARALGIPAVSGIRGIHKMLAHGQDLLLNGDTGEVVLWPSPHTLRTCPTSRRAEGSRITRVEPVEGLKVMANMSRASEVDAVLECDAEGIGLYRTEFECFVRGRVLSEDEQYEAYAKVVKAMGGRPVSIRLLDFGADKAAKFLDLGEEDNPCLGYRGARLLMNEPDLLRPQARALARASQHGPVNVIYPMIIDSTQFLILREMFRSHIGDIEAGELKHGVMFEVPSACLDAEDILSVAEFGSIGSNDLVQYLFAVDRNNEKVAYDYTPDRPVFWRLLRQVSDAAKAANRPLSLCGELGGQPEHTRRLLDTGLEQVSVSPRLVGLARVSARKTLAARPV